MGVASPLTICQSIANPLPIRQSIVNPSPIHCQPAHPLSTASASKRIPTSVEEKQHTGSYHHHLHPLVSGVLPSFLFNHTCPAVWSSDIVQLHSTVYYIPSSTS